ncbi:P-loop containing nucleoside triphosphate hydrolase protein [Panaeolus papilionaceus]|nr:P-loop containing nucleoside triphosphate hydrolase protein [Panaeolus papilionaceus]
MTTVTTPKIKTHAKKRYLKKKKERKKLKKVTASARPKTKSTTQDSDSENIAENDISDGEVSQTSERESSVKASPKRSKKKRSRVEGVEEGEKENDDDMVVDKEDAITAERAPSPPFESSKQPAPLPFFPLPTLPNAPSKSALALQGLDKALIDAQLVSPSTTLAVPSGNEDGGTRLNEKLRKRLHDIGITELFAVQTALLPFLLPPVESSRSLYLPYGASSDLCVSAPTGSGKTLAYVLPIIETLSVRVVTRLRALIVLPTRDLVSQVRETFETLSKGTGLKVGTATGQHSFNHEQSQLVQTTSSVQGGSSKVDILICTPGRLIDHIVGTPNFSLQHLRFLVIDEADRLLAQSFQDWLAQVLAATQGSTQQKCDELLNSPPNKSTFDVAKPDAVAPFLTGLLDIPHIPAFFTERKQSSCQKLLFSATLTRDPGKIVALNLRKPRYFIVQGSVKDTDPLRSDVLDVVMEKFSMPETLSEHMLVVESSQKPLVFFHLVHNREVTNALVFTKSAESTSRLVHLFEYFEEARAASNRDLSPLVVRAYSSDLPNHERKSILEQFRAQQIHILVCSDLISRGIDITHVSHVVSYDVPVDMRKYVHRVGRTARAGREGDAWTLVEEQEARYFKQMLKQGGQSDKVKRLRVRERELEPMKPFYEIALNKLKELYTRQQL